MPVHSIVQKQSVCFITFTCHDWLPLIARGEGYGAVCEFFEVLKHKGHSVTGYVIMRNHVHLLLHYTGNEKNLNTVIGSRERIKPK